MTKAIPVEVTFKKTGKTASMVFPINQVAMAMTPSYDGDSTKRITAMSARAVLETVDYVEKVTGEKANRSVMEVVKLLELGKIHTIVWTNGIRIYK